MSYGLYKSGTFTNLGTVVGGGGIRFTGAGAFLANYGDVVGTATVGVDLVNGGTVFNGLDAGDHRPGFGRLLGNLGVRVVNAGGTITGSLASGVVAYGNSYLRNENGTVRGGFVGAYLGSGTVVNNGGLITGDRAVGVSIGANGTVLQNATGGISGGNVGVSIASGAANVYNYGYIAANGATNTGTGIDAGQRRRERDQLRRRLRLRRRQRRGPHRQPGLEPAPERRRDHRPLRLRRRHQRHPRRHLGLRAQRRFHRRRVRGDRHRQHRGQQLRHDHRPLRFGRSRSTATRRSSTRRAE